ncbi:hypothetical protein LCGC14_1330780, partial [marine sediment metagenome]
FLDLFAKQRYIACSGGVHEGIAREYKPPVEDYKSNVRREHKLEQEHGRVTSTALANIPKSGQLTQPEAMTILKLVYPKAPENDIIRTAIFCKDFGLHPLANEVYLIPFKDKWVMVVGIPANRKMAHNLKGEFSFLDDTPRAASQEEIVKQFGADSDEAKLNVISVTKLEGVGGNKAIGFGLWPKKEAPYGLDKGNTQRNMANIRSERQAMDRLPGKPMPQVEVIDAKYTVLPDVGKVDTTTGEIKEGITEGELKEVPADEIPQPTPEAPESSIGVSKGEGNSIIDMEWLNEQLKKLQTGKPEVWGEENILSFMMKTYKVEGETIQEAAGKLDKGAAKHFTDRVKEGLDKL